MSKIEMEFKLWTSKKKIKNDKNYKYKEISIHSNLNSSDNIMTHLIVD